MNSSSTGVAKPDPRFYEFLAEKLGEKPEDILLVDDRVENIEGAKRCGFNTLHYQPLAVLSEAILEALRRCEFAN